MLGGNLQQFYFAPVIFKLKTIIFQLFATTSFGAKAQVILTYYFFVNISSELHAQIYKIYWS